jgi:hypothetical protein
MRKSLKLFSLLFLVLSIGLTACCLPRVNSQSSTIVKVEPSTTSPDMGQPFTVIISVMNVQNLYGLEVDLKWDASVLQATAVDIRAGVESYSDGVLHQSSNSPPIFIAENNLTQSQGEYTLTVTSTAPAPSFSGSGNIVKITFSPIRLGTSALNLQSQLYDYPPIDRDPRLSLAIDHTDQDSSVTVTTAGSTTVTPSSTTTTSHAPVTSTPNVNPYSPTPTQTSEPQQNDNTRGFAQYLIVMVLVVLLTIIAILIVLRRKKKQ